MNYDIVLLVVSILQLFALYKIIKEYEFLGMVAEELDEKADELEEIHQDILDKADNIHRSLLNQKDQVAEVLKKWDQNGVRTDKS